MVRYAEQWAALHTPKSNEESIYFKKILQFIYLISEARCTVLRCFKTSTKFLPTDSLGKMCAVSDVSFTIVHFSAF